MFVKLAFLKVFTIHVLVYLTYLAMIEHQRSPLKLVYVEVKGMEEEVHSSSLLQCFSLIMRLSFQLVAFLLFYKDRNLGKLFCVITFQEDI